MYNGEKLPPTILVIFGITGDLSHRYLLPALDTVIKTKQLTQEFKIIGISRRDINKERLFTIKNKALEKFSETLKMDLDSEHSYSELRLKLEQVAKTFKSEPEIIYYLSVPPVAVLPIIRRLGESGLNSKNAKLLLEKPFGIDLESSKELITEIEKCFPEEQVYRIDHYLSKEMAQNIVVFLGSNTLFRHAWDNKYIQKIEINAAEKIGVEGRAAFYDSTGALRDFVQSHLLQLAALVLMEPCSGVFEFEELPVRRLAALREIKVNLHKAIRAQYEGYQDEVKEPHSKTETFVSLVAESDSPRWTGVPIKLTTGKKLSEKLTEIKVYFRKTAASEENLLILRIQPREAIELQLWIKEPGYSRRLQKLPLHFTYGQHFKHLPDAYEQVLIDAMQSSHGLFASSEEVLASWEVLQPLQAKWKADQDDLIIYRPGSTIQEVVEQAKEAT